MIPITIETKTFFRNSCMVLAKCILIKCFDYLDFDTAFFSQVIEYTKKGGIITERKTKLIKKGGIITERKTSLIIVRIGSTN